MSSPEQQLQQAFAQLHAPDEVRQLALAHIENVRARESVTPSAQPEKESPFCKKTNKCSVIINPHLGRKAQAKRRRWYWALPLAACLILAVLGFGVLKVGEPTPALLAYVDIDVNPSIELVVNERNAVVGVETLNNDARTALGSLNLKGLTYEQALKTLFASQGMASFLAKDAQVEISVTSDDNALASTLVNQSNATLKNLPYTTHCQAVDAATHTAARELGMGAGKYLVATELVDLDSNYSMEMCSHMSMRALRDAIAECHSENARTGNRGGQHGNHAALSNTPESQSKPSQSTQPQPAPSQTPQTPGAHGGGMRHGQQHE